LRESFIRFCFFYFRTSRAELDYAQQCSHVLLRSTLPDLVVGDIQCHQFYSRFCSGNTSINSRFTLVLYHQHQPTSGGACWPPVLLPRRSRTTTSRTRLPNEDDSSKLFHILLIIHTCWVHVKIRRTWCSFHSSLRESSTTVQQQANDDDVFYCNLDRGGLDIRGNV
jgi:hypothetical protein